ncbi:carbamoyl-phosphate synthase (glutamine-hydrolyzing) large subunit [Candidatus Woesearchaeota archaeon]|nr:carbamoyl-phosphate synthase (glutamine-hydrolyzing) large subunit [Candidatus Woesearchaeota archaeon]
MNHLKKILVLGSGALKISQSGEFDYSGSQCLKALKEEGIESVLINPNIATIQTSEGMADKLYFLPITPYFVEQVIKKEQPDGILLSFGGQTALNCGVELQQKGILAKYNVTVLGTPVASIIATEDRKLFAEKLQEIHVPIAKSVSVTSAESAAVVAGQIGFPVMLRSAFSLGGLGSGVCYTKEEVTALAKTALTTVPQILIEEFLGGWKEIEYEVVRDKYGNCIAVCNMENVDPMGIHTGESIVVAPSQTLDNKEYFVLRETAIKVIKHLGIVGECNIQYALNQNSREFRVIEVNARLSRSSALASKATGYPLAYVAAKLALGYGLHEIKNSVTKVTSAFFEPSLDYLVVKIPRWDLQKFKHVNQQIGSEMKSVGEVMAIGRNFEEALQKGLRMLYIGVEGVIGAMNGISFEDLESELSHPTDKRIFAIAQALAEGYDIDFIHALTKIDRFFLYKIKNIVDTVTLLKVQSLNIESINGELLKLAKQQGFSDKAIGILLNKTELEIRLLRKEYKIVPCIKQIDTMAGEYPAQTNYLYLTYNGSEHDIRRSKNAIIVLGSGPYRIGSSVEFDWCCVNTINTIRNVKNTAIMINCNPETVSTDYDVCDRLYFEELTLERVLDIYEFEDPNGVILAMGGQIPNNLALPLMKNGVIILGTSPLHIDQAENRHKFSQLLDQLKIDQPEWKELTNIEEAKIFSHNVEYPVLVRPSYVLSGAAMNVVYSDEYLEKYLQQAATINPEHPVVISKFIQDAKEIEIDAVAKEGEILLYAITEHIENAGIHSGDATMILPGQKLYLETVRKIKTRAQAIARALNITGPFNIQFIAKDNHVKVIECNLRASRSFPFCSKTFKINFIELATKAILNYNVEKVDKSIFDLGYVGVKASQFSFSRLKGTDPVLGVEMASTGEVACFGDSVEEALLKSLISAGIELPQQNILISLSGRQVRLKLLPQIEKLQTMGFHLFGTPTTAEYYNENGINITTLYKIHEEKDPNVIEYIANKKIDFVICMFDEGIPEKKKDAVLIRQKAVECSIPLMTNYHLAKLFIDAMYDLKTEDLVIKEYHEY